MSTPEGQHYWKPRPMVSLKADLPGGHYRRRVCTFGASGHLSIHLGRAVASAPELSSNSSIWVLFSVYLFLGSIFFIIINKLSFCPRGPKRYLFSLSLPSSRPATGRSFCLINLYKICFAQIASFFCFLTVLFTFCLCHSVFSKVGFYFFM